MTSKLIDSIFALSPAVRYVATYLDGDLKTVSRDDLDNSSEEGTDVFEELLVNPALLTLATQRGNIDCGGLDYLLVRYGNFFQFVKRIAGGHISVCLEPDSNAVSISTTICETLEGTS